MSGRHRRRAAFALAGGLWAGCGAAPSPAPREEASAVSNSDSKIDDLLAKAHDLLYADLEAEMARAASPGGPVATEKYERARALFQEVLALDGENAEARAGVEACDEMLTPYIPLQRLEAPAMLGIGEAPPPPPTTPWEVRRQMRARDRAGMRFTGQVFSAARERYAEEAEAIVAAAKAAVSRGELDPAAAMADGLSRLRALQAAADQSWKGHGPRFFDEAARALADALGQPAPAGD